jgi:hypothetical protein
MNPSPITAKVLVTGLKSSGKTSLLFTLETDEFPREDRLQKIRYDAFFKSVRGVKGGQLGMNFCHVWMSLEMCDGGSQVDETSEGDGDVGLFCVDARDLTLPEKSHENIDILVITKCDLVPRLDYTKIEEWCREKGCFYTLTSAKTGQGLAELVDGIFRIVSMKRMRDYERFSRYLVPVKESRWKRLLFWKRRREVVERHQRRTSIVEHTQGDVQDLIAPVKVLAKELPAFESGHLRPPVLFPPPEIARLTLVKRTSTSDDLGIDDFEIRCKETVIKCSSKALRKCRYFESLLSGKYLPVSSVDLVEFEPRHVQVLLDSLYGRELNVKVQGSPVEIWQEYHDLFRLSHYVGYDTLCVELQVQLQDLLENWKPESKGVKLSLNEWNEMYQECIGMRLHHLVACLEWLALFWHRYWKDEAFTGIDVLQYPSRSYLFQQESLNQ